MKPTKTTIVYVFGFIEDECVFNTISFMKN